MSSKMSSGGSTKESGRRKYRGNRGGSGGAKEGVKPGNTHNTVTRAVMKCCPANLQGWRKEWRMAEVCGRHYFLQQIYYCFTIRALHTTQTGKLHNCQRVTCLTSTSSTTELVATLMQYTVGFSGKKVRPSFHRPNIYTPGLLGTLIAFVSFWLLLTADHWKNVQW